MSKKVEKKLELTDTLLEWDEKSKYRLVFIEKKWICDIIRIQLADTENARIAI